MSARRSASATETVAMRVPWAVPLTRAASSGTYDATGPGAAVRRGSHVRSACSIDARAHSWCSGERPSHVSTGLGSRLGVCALARAFASGRALSLAVQPLESWRELWVFHERAGSWTVDVIPPGLDNPGEGYVDFAGYAPGTRRLLIAREVKDRGRFRRSFEELRLDDLALVRQASSPELLRDFGRWQDVAWRRDTLALH
jgi:hypothetical protein